MAKAVTIKSIRDATRLTFRDVVAESFTAEVESSHFSAKVSTSTYYVGPPSVMFDEMARDWRGWEGEKLWGTLEDEIRLAAKTDRLGHIELIIEMRDYTAPADWRLTATLHLEAGKLEELARELRDVFERAEQN